MLRFLLAFALVVAGCSGKNSSFEKFTTIDAKESVDVPKNQKPLPHGILVTKQEADIEEEPEENIEALAMHTPKIHAITVKPRESLQLYSEWSGVSTGELKLQNRGKMPAYGPEKYYIPLSLAELEVFHQRREDYWRTKTEKLMGLFHSKRGWYTVKSGDTLDRIARKHNCPLWFLARLNENVAPTKIHPGQKLAVVTLTEKLLKPDDDEAAGSSGGKLGYEPGSSFEVIVRRGETASRLARWSGLSLNEIKQSNRHIKNLNKLSVGTRVKLPITVKAQKIFLKKRKQYADRKK